MKNLLRAFLSCVIASLLQAQWQQDVRLTNDPGWSTTSFNNAWCIASNGNTVHVVWYDNRDGNYEIYYKRSIDEGSNWGPDTRLTDNSAASEWPAISVSGSDVHIVWYDFRDGNNEIYYKRSTDSGTSWGLDTRLTDQSSNSDYPSISAAGNNVNIVWRDGRDGNWEVYYKNSTDSGLNWSADTRLTTESHESFNPSISADGPGVHVTWYDYRDGGAEIYYKHSLDGGITWESDTRLTNNSASSLAPCISVYNSVVHLVWQDDGIIFYKRSTDAGINWEQEISLTVDDSSFLPSITVSELNIHVVWAFEYPLNREIFYKHSTDGGTTWEENVRLTNAPSEGWLPSVSVSGSLVHVLWRDGRDGNNEIYYKQNPTGNVTPVEDGYYSSLNEFKLEQNYPNPFNPSTKISWLSPVGSHQTLKVYDVLGNEIVTLVDEYKPAGRYEVEFIPSSIKHHPSSGVYLCRLQTDNFSRTIKMLYLK
jgi:hypothetical protein